MTPKQVSQKGCFTCSHSHLSVSLRLNFWCTNNSDLGTAAHAYISLQQATVRGYSDWSIPIQVQPLYCRQFNPIQLKSTTQWGGVALPRKTWVLQGRRERGWIIDVHSLQVVRTNCHSSSYIFWANVIMVKYKIFTRKKKWSFYSKLCFFKYAKPVGLSEIKESN